MTWKPTNRPETASIGPIVLMAILGLILSGCGNVLVDLEAARAELNPLLVRHAGVLADGTREEALQSGRDLIASVDCLLANSECPD